MRGLLVAVLLAWFFSPPEWRYAIPLWVPFLLAVGLELEFAIVGKETVNGKDGYWMEWTTSGAGMGGGGPMVMKVLTVVGDSTVTSRVIMQMAGMATVAANVNRIVRRVSGCWGAAELDMPIWSLLDRSCPPESRRCPTGRYRRRPILCH